MPRKPSTHVDDPTAAGIRLREARDAIGLTQAELAEGICSKTYLSRVEAGQRIASLQILRALADRLGTTADYLASGLSPTVEPDPLFEAELAAGTGDVETASKLFEAARRTGSPLVAARSEAGLGRLAYDRGDHEGAVDWLEEAEAAGVLPPPDLSRLRDILGRALALLARYDEALAALERGLADARAAGDQPSVLRFSVLLANLLIDRGNPSRAEETLASVMDEVRSAEDPVALSNLYWSQARLHASQGRHELAARYAKMAHVALEATEHVVFAARALTLSAHIENDRGNHGEALNFVERAEPVLASARNRYDEGMLLLEKARALGALGQREEAIAIALGARARFEHAHPTSAARAYMVAAGLFRDLKDNAHALELYELAAESLPVSDRHLVEIYQGMAAIYEVEGRDAEAMEYLKRALGAQTQILQP